MKCAICKKMLVRKETETWCFHISFPGPVCRDHHGVKEEYDRLLAETSKELAGKLKE